MIGRAKALPSPAADPVCAHGRRCSAPVECSARLHPPQAQARRAAAPATWPKTAGAVALAASIPAADALNAGTSSGYLPWYVWRILTWLARSQRYASVQMGTSACRLVGRFALALGGERMAAIATSVPSASERLAAGGSPDWSRFPWRRAAPPDRHAALWGPPSRMPSAHALAAKVPTPLSLPAAFQPPPPAMGVDIVAQAHGEGGPTIHPPRPPTPLHTVVRQDGTS